MQIHHTHKKNSSFTEVASEHEQNALKCSLKVR